MLKVPITSAHSISERRTPVSVLVLCTCGWSREISRKQNAFARAAKVKKAIREHVKWVAENA